MKTYLTKPFILLCFFFCTSSTSVFSTAIDDLNQVIFYANQAKNNAKDARTAARDLAAVYFQLNDPNIGGYIILIQNEMSELEEASDEINYYIQSAANQNAAINPDDILDWSSELEGLEDQVNQEALNLQQLIANGQRSAARTSYRLLLSYFKQQINLAKAIKNEAVALKSVAQIYNVRIELLYNGQVYTGSTTLGGFYGYNETLGQYFYPAYGGEDDELLNLPGGVYSFGSYDGYFDGTNTVTTTLDPALIGSDGFIVVQLNYWSE